jgi:hypothetical protein
MQQDGSEKMLSEERRKEIFSALVEAQDQNRTVEQSRKEVAKRFGLSLSQIRKIEEEGLDNELPPLCRAREPHGRLKASGGVSSPREAGIAPSRASPV